VTAQSTDETRIATADGATKPIRLVAPRRSVIEHLQGIWLYRELLVALVRKELKVKYKNSALGFAWSLLNPLLYLVVYYYVFEVMLGSGIPNFPLFLLSGLLVWNLFSTSAVTGVSAIVANGSLVKKVSFPREVLPLAGVGAALVHFLLQTIAIPGLLVTLLLAAALAILLSAANVYARDTQHLLELVMLMWFWLTPIVYPYRLVQDKLDAHGISWIALLNPMTSVTLAFQRALYGHVDSAGRGSSGAEILPAHAGALWYLGNLALVAAGAAVLLVLAIMVFDRVEGSFAEEI
jgi:ABC-2 type transport system permease protein